MQSFTKWFLTVAVVLFCKTFLWAQDGSYTYLTTKSIPHLLASTSWNSHTAGNLSLTDSIYIVKGITTETSLNIGILTDTVVALDPDFPQKVFFYDSELQPLFVFQLETFTRLSTAGQIDSTYYFSSEISYSFLSSPPITPPIPASPFPGGGGEAKLIFGVNPYTGQVKREVFVENPLLQQWSYPYEPYQGFCNAFGLLNFSDSRAHPVVPVINGGLVCDIRIYDELSVLWADSTIEMGADVTNFAMGQLVYQPQSEVLNAEDYGFCANTYQFNFSLFPSEEDGKLYKVGNITGDVCDIDPAGTLFTPTDLDPNTDDFTTFLAKSSPDGSSDWVTSLFSYRRPPGTTGTSGSYIVPNYMYEVDNKTFLCMNQSYGALNPEDSLYYRNVFDRDSVYNDYIPQVLPSGDTMPGSIGYRTTELYAFDSDGLPFKKMARRSKESYSYFNLSLLYKINNQLVWVLPHQNPADTTEMLTMETANGISTVPIDFPAGYGYKLLWLNSDLEIQDQGNIPYQPAVEGWASTLQLITISPYKNDSIFIEAKVASGTSVNMDYTGNTDWITYDSPTRIFAFYSKSGVDKVSEKAVNTNIVLFPNPVDQVLNVRFKTQNTFTSYKVFDLTGQMLLSGAISDTGPTFQIKTNGLAQGVYVLSLTGKGEPSSALFVVR